MRVAAVELGPDQIRVNAINADQVETPMFMRFVEERAAMRGITPSDQLESYRKRNAMGVSLIPADAVADIAALLASDRFRYTTGDIITIDGGLASTRFPADRRSPFSPRLLSTRRLYPVVPLLFAHGPADNDRDVVGTAIVEGVLHQRFAHLPRRRHVEQPLTDSRIGYMLGEAITAQHARHLPHT